MARGKRADARQINKLERQKRCIELRQQGLSYRQIVNQLAQEGIATNPTTVMKDIESAMQGAIQENVSLGQDLKQTELTKLDNIESRLYTILDETEDQELKLKTIDRLLKAMDRRAKYMGYDAPVKKESDVTGQVQIVVVEDDTIGGEDDARDDLAA